jgi:Trypsin-like peptidase domain
MRNVKKFIHKQIKFSFPPKTDLSVLGSVETIDSRPITVFPFVSIANFREKRLRKFYTPHGTGFFIHKSGLFVTAKHVPISNDANPLDNIIAIHNYGNYTCIKHVKNFHIHPTADIAIGFLDIHDVHNKFIWGNNLLYPHLIPSFVPLQIGMKVSNFGYGGSSVAYTNSRYQEGNFPCQWHHGDITQLFLNGRDLSLQTGAVFENTLNTIGLASGGPVFNEYGQVIGINSSSFDGEPPISYSTPIYTIRDMSVLHPTFGEIKVVDLLSMT